MKILKGLGLLGGLGAAGYGAYRGARGVGRMLRRPPTNMEKVKALYQRHQNKINMGAAGLGGFALGNMVD